MADEAKPTAKPKVPADNNKRLHFLEEHAPKVLLATTAMIAVIMPDLEIAPASADEDPLVHAIRLMGELAEAAKEGRQHAEAQEAKLRDVLAAAGLLPDPDDGDETLFDVVLIEIARLGKIDEAAQDPDNELAALKAKIVNLEEDLAKAEAETAKAIRAGNTKIRRAKRGSKAKVRSVAVVDGGTDRKKLVDLMLDPATQFEIVLSNGESEILEFDPVTVGSGGFQRRGAGGFDLIEPMVVRGAGTEHRVRGVGLFCKGKLLAYSEFPNAVTVPVGQEVKFERMIGFKSVDPAAK